MKYEEKAMSYHLGRPSYPSKAIDYIFRNAPSDVVVADIGAGTGKLTLMLAERAKKVYAVEQDEQMRMILLSETTENDVVVVNGCAEETNLPDCSVDIICVAQAFHWFDVRKFSLEINRILRKGGKIYILHNIFPKLLEDILPNKKETPEEMIVQKEYREQQRRAFWSGNYIEQTFDNSVLYSKEQFFDYFFSFSTTPTRDSTIEDSDYNSMVEAVNAAFDKLSSNGQVMLPFITKLYTGDIGEDKNKTIS